MIAIMALAHEKWPRCSKENAGLAVSVPTFWRSRDLPVMACRRIEERAFIFLGRPAMHVIRRHGSFGVVVTQKLAAQAIPLVGALGGAAVNYAFIEHFQDMARGHFIVRRLERAYGKEVVQRV
jgi:EcsC protein family